MKKIEWSHQARLDLLDVVTFLRTQRPSAARRFVAQLDKSLRQVSRFPKSGRPIPEQQIAVSADSDDREIVVLRWRIAYRSTAGRIWILYVIHGARRFPPVR